MRALVRAESVLLGLAIAVATALFVYEHLGRTTFVNGELVLDAPLAIPPLLEPAIEGDDKTFTLVLQKGETAFLPGAAAPSWGVNGPYLGPTLRAHRGDHVAFRVSNAVGEPTTLHWHGMPLPAAMDGGPHQVIQPGEVWRPRWTIDNQAATLWYHPHQMGKTATHVHNGLAGLFIVDDENSDRLALPKTYGVDDLPVIVQDRHFNGAGQPDYNPSDDGQFGDRILVNGTYAPFAAVPAGMVRLRLLNASDARRYNFGFDDDRAFSQIATDGGFLETPVERKRLLLSPGERAEIVVNMARSGPATLMSYKVIEFDDNIFADIRKWFLGVDGDEHEVFKILELRPSGRATESAPIPERLNVISRWSEQDASKIRRFVLNPDHMINAKKMDHDRIDEIVRAGDIEIWRIDNDTARSHPFHIHGVQFLILDRNGTPPPPYERGWKDTVAVHRAETIRVIARFPDFSDERAPYMYHCHMLEHEDHGMMGQFIVVAGSSTKFGINLGPGAPLVDAHRH